MLSYMQEEGRISEFLKLLGYRHANPQKSESQMNNTASCSQLKTWSGRSNMRE